MATAQPTNRDITADTAIDAPAGSTFLGVTPDKRVALFYLPEVDAMNNALRFDRIQQLTDEQKQQVIENLGLDEVIRSLLPAPDLEAQRTSALSVLTMVSAFIRAQAISLDAL